MDDRGKGQEKHLQRGRILIAPFCLSSAQLWVIEETLDLPTILQQKQTKILSNFPVSFKEKVCSFRHFLPTLWRGGKKTQQGSKGLNGKTHSAQRNPFILSLLGSIIEQVGRYLELRFYLFPLEQQNKWRNQSDWSKHGK